MITDAYPYRESIDFTIEHAPVENKELTDYTSVTFFYSLEPPTNGSPLPPVGDRKVAAPEHFTFVPGWNVPMHTMSLQNATWAKHSTMIGDSRVRSFSVRTTGDDIFGPHHISFICDIPAEGRYNVGIKALQGPDQGIVQIFRHDVPMGEVVNLYAENRSLSDVLPLGVHDMREGDNIVFLHLVGKDERSSGIGLDLVEIVFEKME
jgi:hypothetical protein